MIKRSGNGILLWRLPVGVLGGLLSSLAMPRENIWPLIFVSVALILVFLVRHWSVLPQVLLFT